MLHIGGQIDIMQQQLNEISPKDNERALPAAFVRSLIDKHRKIIAFSDSIEYLFSHIALMQFFSNTLIICCIGFLIVTVSIPCRGTFVRSFQSCARGNIFYTSAPARYVSKRKLHDRLVLSSRCYICSYVCSSGFYVSS